MWVLLTGIQAFKSQKTLILNNFRTLGKIKLLKFFKKSFSSLILKGFVDYYDNKDLNKNLQQLKIHKLVDHRKKEIGLLFPVNYPISWLPKIFSTKRFTLCENVKKSNFKKAKLIPGRKDGYQGLLVQNLDLHTTETELYKMFSPFGFIESINFPIFSPYKKSTLKATIFYRLLDCSVKAATYMDGKYFRGKILKIQKTKALNYSPPTHRLPVIKWFNLIQKRSKTVETLNKPDFNHFLKQLNIDNLKNFSPTLTQNMSNPRIQEVSVDQITKILPESRLSNELDLFLVDQGINITSFYHDNNIKTIGKTLCIKNYPSKKKEIVKKTFSKFGQIKIFIYYESLSFCLIEFQNILSTILAWNFLWGVQDFSENLRFYWLSVPKKTKWVENNIVFQDQKKNSNVKFIKKEKKSYTNDLSLSNNKKKDDENRFIIKKTRKKFYTDRTNEKNVRFFSVMVIKNLPFQTELFSLKKELAKFGKIARIRIPKGKSSLSRGFAFVYFYSLEEAKLAIIRSRNLNICGRNVKVKLLSKN